MIDELGDMVGAAGPFQYWLAAGIFAVAFFFIVSEKIHKTKAALLGGAARLLLLTRGSDGVTAYLADGRDVSVPAERAEVVDTVGAGDTFNAGFLAEAQALGLLTKGGFGPETGLDALRRCLSLGARAAAVTVSRAGANPPWRSELPG